MGVRCPQTSFAANKKPVWLSVLPGRPGVPVQGLLFVFVLELCEEMSRCGSFITCVEHSLNPFSLKPWVFLSLWRIPLLNGFSPLFSCSLFWEALISQMLHFLDWLFVAHCFSIISIFLSRYSFWVFQFYFPDHLDFLSFLITLYSLAFNLNKFFQILCFFFSWFPTPILYRGNTLWNLLIIVVF